MPFLRRLPRHDRRSVRFDDIAGAAVWGLLVPESIAYAGLPPHVGMG